MPADGRQAQANGLKVDRQGRLIVADAGGGRILRIGQPRVGKPPAIEVLADTFEGKPLDAPNDVALDLAGNVYFSDPGSSNAERPTGSIYRCDAATGQARAARYRTWPIPMVGRHAGPEASLCGREANDIAC